MKRVVHIALTVLLMMIVSRFLVRIVDATVQIDDDMGMLIMILIVLNSAIAGGSYMLYRKLKR